MIVLIEIKLKASCLKIGRAFAMIVCQKWAFKYVSRAFLLSVSKL